MCSEPFLLSSYPAHWTDDLLLACPNYRHFSSPKKLAARALSLLITLTIFPACLLIDTALYAGKALYQNSIKLLSSSQNPKQIACAEKTNSVAIKCIRSLFSWPAGLIWPDIVTNHFLRQAAPSKDIHPTGKLYVGKAKCHFPTRVGQVVRLVQEACKTNKKVSIAGTGYCQGKQTIPPSSDDLHINMQHIKHVHIDKDSKVARVGAGATWSDIQKAADPLGLAVQVMQASNVFSIGGSISANCHGWDHMAGSVGNTVVSITFVDAKGVKKTVTPKDEEFGCILGGYGLFGVILEAEIQLTDNQVLFDEGERVEIDDYPKYFDEKVLTNPNIKMHLYRLSLQRGKLLQSGWAENYCEKQAQAKTDDLTDEPPRGTDVDRILVNIARNSFLFRHLYWKKTEYELAAIHKATRNEIMRPKINAAFATNSKASTEWLQEYFVSKDKLPEFLKFLASVVNENDVALLNASVRYVKQDTRAKMGYARGGDRFAIVLFFSQSLNAEEVMKTKLWVQKVVDKLGDLGGSFYLPYMHFATKDQFKTCYPQWEEIQKAKKKYDPEGRFDNGLHRDYLLGD